MMNKKKRSKPGPKPSKEAAKRVKFTTMLNHTLVDKLKALAKKKGVLVNELIESGIRKVYFKK